VSPAWVERARAATPGDVWSLSFTVWERGSGAEVGGCAFKGPPDADGVVEVAYGIDDPHQRKGYATEATEAMVSLALSRGVRVVRAHAKPDNRASLRVLEKCGFRPLGMVVDPEDGEVWRFERAGADGAAA
jgi:[ribosomal protein S5]-alanine N-acetyltransferase